MPQQESSRPGRGRPRDPARGEAIRRATLELLDELGYHGLTMIDVAQRAGVAKTTIYRRWDSKAEMVLDAIAEQVVPREFEETGDALADMRSVVAQFYARVAGRAHTELPMAPAALLREAELTDAFHKRFVTPMRDHARALAERAIEQGKLREDVDPTMLVDLLTAPAVYKPVVLDERAGADDADALFDMVMRGCLRGDEPRV
jgi:AcrR family transcriptional regulator